MTGGNGMVEEVVERGPDAGAGIQALIERRMQLLVQQREEIAQKTQGLTRELQRLAAMDVGCQGALATLEALRKELEDGSEPD